MLSTYSDKTFSLSFYNLHTTAFLLELSASHSFTLSPILRQHGRAAATILLATLSSPAATATEPSHSTIHSHGHLWTYDPFGTHPTGTPTPPLHSIAYHVTTGTHFITFCEPAIPTTSTATTSNSRSYYSDHHLIQAQSHLSGSTCTTVHSPISPANNSRLITRPSTSPHHTAHTMVTPCRHRRTSHLRCVSMASRLPWHSRLHGQDSEPRKILWPHSDTQHC